MHYKVINLDSTAIENNKEHDKKWLFIRMQNLFVCKRFK